MSISYYFSGVGFDFDALKVEGPKVGLVPFDDPNNDVDIQCYSFNKHFFWVYRCDDNSSSFCTHGINSPDGIYTLSEAIGAECVDEWELEEDELIYGQILKMIPEDSSYFI